ncbi:hypothetical protein BH24DEI1_BH24DEI1_11040 [soil metagenome]
MKTLVIALLLATLLTAGTATAKSPLTLRFNDKAMNYAAVDADDYGVNVSADRMRDVAYLKLGYQDNALTVFLSSQPQLDSLKLAISDLPRYVSFGSDPGAASLRNARDSRYTSNKVANISDVEEISFIRYAVSVNDLRVVHHNYSLKSRVASYDRALSELGFSRVQEAGWRNGGTYVYQNGTGSVRLMFHREGDGVTLRMQSL